MSITIIGLRGGVDEGKSDWISCFRQLTFEKAEVVLLGVRIEKKRQKVQEKILKKVQHSFKSTAIHISRESY